MTIGVFLMDGNFEKNGKYFEGVIWLFNGYVYKESY